MKQITFNIHDCGCVEIDNIGSSDGFELMCAAWFVLTTINAHTDVIPLEIAEEILLQSIERIKRSATCVERHKKANAN